ncbi:MORN repeat-containing protein 5-like [Dysidea avara]|uniref:MORN repeat-containing protein 5-like n=1 Tax=Dysidea avara TaxID=196820 RepID=UPI00333374A1
MADQQQAEVEFLTGSSYQGNFVNERMEGLGEYTFPSGTKYIGGMKDGMFHGQGTLYFTNGGRFEAEWDKGKAVGPGIGGTYIFKEGLKYEADSWQYCDGIDRRFYSEVCNGLQPAGQSQKVDQEPAKTIPLGWYDCGDGFYNPDNRVVYDYDVQFLRNADIDEHEWIVSTCHKGVKDGEPLPYAMETSKTRT